MNLSRLILPFSCLFLTANLHAQWTKEDSLWVEGVKSGKVRIELNEETKKAIEEGRFIGTDKPMNPELYEAPPRLPVTKEFIGIRAEELARDSIDFSSLPPYVFILYNIPDSANAKSLVYVAPPVDYIRMKLIPIGTNGFYLKAYSGDLSPLIKDGQSRGGVIGTIGYAFSMEDILRQLFWASERAKRKNRKHATAWKYY